MVALDMNNPYTSADPNVLLGLWSIILNHHNWSPSTLNTDTCKHIAQLLTDHQLIHHSSSLIDSSNSHSTHAKVIARKKINAEVARLATTINILLDCTKYGPPKWIGTLLVHVWVKQVPNSSLPNAKSWTNALLTIVLRPSDPISLRMYASTVLVLLLKHSAQFNENMRDLIAPTVLKLAPVLTKWCTIDSSENLIVHALHLTSVLVTIAPSALSKSACSLLENALIALFRFPKSKNVHVIALTVAYLCPITKTTTDFWEVVFLNALGSIHYALDHLLADQLDDQCKPDCVSDRKLANTPSLHSTSATSFLQAMEVLAVCSELIHQMLKVCIPGKSVSIPVSVLIATATRAMSAMINLSTLPVTSDTSVYLPWMYTPRSAKLILANLIVPVLSAATTHYALSSLFPHAKSLERLLARALDMPLVRPITYDLIALTARLFSTQSLIKIIGTKPYVVTDLMNNCAHASNALSAVIQAHGPNIPSSVRAHWDTALIPRLLCTQSGGPVLDTACMSALVPSLVSSHGVAPYSCLSLMSNVVMQVNGPWVTIVNAVVHPVRVPRLQETIMCTDKSEESASQSMGDSHIMKSEDMVGEANTPKEECTVHDIVGEASTLDEEYSVDLHVSEIHVVPPEHKQHGLSNIEENCDAAPPGYELDPCGPFFSVPILKAPEIAPQASDLGMSESEDSLMEDIEIVDSGPDSDMEY